MEKGLTDQITTHLDRHDPYEIMRGVLLAPFSFTAMGTLMGVWRNPFFTKMTPVEGWELPSLFIRPLTFPWWKAAPAREFEGDRHDQAERSRYELRALHRCNRECDQGDRSNRKGFL